MSWVPRRGPALRWSPFARRAPQPTERAAHAAGARKMAGRDVRDGIESRRHSRINFAQYSAQVVAQFADFLIAVFRILGQRPIEDQLQTWRHGIRSSFVQGLWLFM